MRLGLVYSQIEQIERVVQGGGQRIVLSSKHGKYCYHHFTFSKPTLPETNYDITPNWIATIDKFA